jgi:hypothetical protein
LGYLDDIDATLRRTLINNSNISKLVGTRVYPTYLAGVKDPKYPCICFMRISAPRDYRYTKRVSPAYDMYIYSSKDYSETDLIFDNIRLTLDNEFFPAPNDGARIQFRITTNASQEMDPDSTLYYGMFRIQVFAFFK